MKKDWGGVALEYLLVSLFAISSSLILIAFLSKTVHQKWKELAEKMNWEDELPHFPWQE